MTTATVTLTEFLSARLTEDAGNVWEYADVDRPRWLAEVKAKRGIVDLLTYSSGGITQPTGPEQEAVLRYLASVYANHPDYRDEWRP